MNKLAYFLVALSLFSPLSLSAEQNTYIVDDWPNSRYRIQGDGTVIDTKTGLMWTQCSLGQTYDSSNVSCSGSPSGYVWQSALVAASDYDLADYDDWRLPNINELRSLVAYDRYSPSINSDIFPNTQTSSYWSSSPNSDSSSYTWGFSFSDGEDQDLFRSSSYYVRLVRTDQ